MLDNIIMLFISCICGLAAYFLKRMIDDLDEFKKETKKDLGAIKKEMLSIGLSQASLRDNIHDFEVEIKAKITTAMKEKHSLEDLASFKDRLDVSLKKVEAKAQDITQITDSMSQKHVKLLSYEDKVDKLFAVLKKIEATRKG